MDTRMAKTLSQLKTEIAKLQKEAQRVRSAEIKEVVSKIRKAVAHYSLTPQDIFGKAAAGAPKTAAAAPGKAKKAPPKPKYADDKGNTWVGRGKRPQWFRDALAAGKKPEELAVK